MLLGRLTRDDQLGAGTLAVSGWVQYPSINVQANLIARAAANLGYSSCVVPNSDRVASRERLIYMAPFCTTNIMKFMWMPGAKRCYYGDVMSDPNLNLQAITFSRNYPFVACSGYTNRLYKKAGVEPRATVHHAVDLEWLTGIRKAKGAVESTVESGAKCTNKRSSDDVVRFTSITHFISFKGLDLLAPALKALYDVHPDGWEFDIYTNGTAPGNQVVNFNKALVADFSGMPNVHLIENNHAFEHDDMMKRLSGFDVYVSSSVSEGFGIPVIESHALGIPTIAGPYEPFTETMSEKVGWYIGGEIETRPRDARECYFYDPLELTDVMLHAIEHPEEIRKKGRAGPTWAKQFDYNKVFPELIDFVA